MKYNVCIVGATGLIGRTVVEELFAKKFPIEELFLVASSRSVDKIIYINETSFKIVQLEKEIFKNMDFVFFCAGSEISRIWVPIALEMGAIVIDNSSYFRMDNNCSLIVPEINFDMININNVIANPNCSTIQSVICLDALKEFGLTKVIYNTYQSISGSGNKALVSKESYYPYNINITCIPKIDNYLENGYTLEEIKMINETKKILQLSGLPVNATCVRVPVDFSHGVSVIVSLEKDFSLEDIYNAFANKGGVKIVDCPTSIHSNGNDYVYIGRIRKDINDPKTLMFYCVADNLRRGAASNAVKIALKIIENYIAYKNQL